MILRMKILLFSFFCSFRNFMSANKSIEIIATLSEKKLCSLCIHFNLTASSFSTLSLLDHGMAHLNLRGTPAKSHSSTAFQLLLKLLN